MAQPTYIARKNEDANFKALTVDSLVIGSSTIEAGAIVLGDDEKITAGASSDVTFEWDTAATPDQAIWDCAADDTVMAFGVAATPQLSFDLKWYGGTAAGASYLYFDASADLIYTVGVDLQFKDNDLLVFGTGTGGTGDVQTYWDATNLLTLATGASAAWLIGAASHLINVTLTGALTVGVDGTGHDVTLFGDTASSKAVWAQANDAWEFTAAKLSLFDNAVLGFGNTTAAPDITLKWDASNLVMASNAAASGWTIGAAGKLINATLTGTLTVGVDDTGHDVKFYGATSGKSLLWDESADKLILTGDLQATGAVVVGVDATGHDVTFFGDTTGCSLLWDQSEDQLVITGPADVPALKIAGAGSVSAAAYAATGAAWNDGGTPAFAADQMYLKIDVGGTVYRIPLFADA